MEQRRSRSLLPTTAEDVSSCAVVAGLLQACVDALRAWIRMVVSLCGANGKKSGTHHHKKITSLQSLVFFCTAALAFGTLEPCMPSDRPCYDLEEVTNLADPQLQSPSQETRSPGCHHLLALHASGHINSDLHCRARERNVKGCERLGV
jgi:hypothetical protein